MITINYNEKFIEELTERIANLTVELLEQKQREKSQLPILLTREETMEILRCGNTKMTELLNRPDFPVLRECGIRIPSHLLLEWIEKNTRKD